MPSSPGPWEVHQPLHHASLQGRALHGQLQPFSPGQLQGSGSHSPCCVHCVGMSCGYCLPESSISNLYMLSAGYLTQCLGNGLRSGAP